jgi:DNA repair protein RecO
VQFITPEGKRTAIARGVRREKSKLAGGIELFAVSDIVIHEGKGDMGIVTSARLVHFYHHILEDYDRLQFGYEAIKQVTKASETVDETEWYDLLQETIAGLDVLAWPRQLVELWFYLRYASLLGYELSFMHDVNGQPLESDKKYQYDVSEKGLRAVANGELGADHIKFLRLVNSKPLRIVAQIGGVEAILADCWLVARQHAAL